MNILLRKSGWIISFVIMTALFSIIAAPIIFYQPTHISMSFRTSDPTAVDLIWGDHGEHVLPMERVGDGPAADGLYHWSGRLPAVNISRLWVRFQGAASSIQVVSLNLVGKQSQSWSWQFTPEQWGQLSNLAPINLPESYSLALKLTGESGVLELADLKPINELTPPEYVATVIYALLLSSALLMLVRREQPVSETSIGQSILRFAGRTVAGQPLFLWCLALLAALGSGWVMARQLAIGGIQRPIWTQLAVDGTEDLPPWAIALYHDAEGTETPSVPFGWQPYPRSHLGILPVDHPSEPIAIQSLETESGRIDLKDVSEGMQRLRLDSDLQLISPDGALIYWPQASRSITLTFAPGSGDIDVLWYDQRVRTTLGSQPTILHMELAAKHQGWALLPASAISRLRLELPGDGRSYTINRLVVWDGEDTSTSAPIGQLEPTGCTITQNGTSLHIQTTASTCALAFERSINQISLAHQWGFTLIAAFLLIAGLWAIQRLNALRKPVQEVDLAPPLRPAPPGSLFREMMIAGAIAISFHILYALVLPVSFATDSLVYYRNAMAFVETWRFSSMSALRTPGYPAFLGAMIYLFGHSITLNILAQNVLIGALAPLVVWAGAPYFGKKASFAMGIIVGISPVVSVLANNLLTEAPYAVAMVAAMLVYARIGDNMRGSLVSGALIGYTTMIRPNGLLLLVLLLGWIAIRAWLSLWTSAKKLGLVRQAVVLLIGYGAIALPWQLHIMSVYHTTDLSHGIAARTLWAGAVLNGRSDADIAIVRPDRAPWPFSQYWGSSTVEPLDYHPSPYAPFYSEVRREVDQKDRMGLIQVAVAAVSQALFMQKQEGFFFIDEVGASFAVLSNPPEWIRYADAPPDDPSQQILANMATRWYPKDSLLRRAFVGLGQSIYNNWGWFSTLALMSILPLALNRALRQFIPCWLAWMAQIIGYSYLGTLGDRYFIVAEPLVLLLATITLLSLAQVAIKYVPALIRRQASTGQTYKS